MVEKKRTLPDDVRNELSAGTARQIPIYPTLRHAKGCAQGASFLHIYSFSMVKTSFRSTLESSQNRRWTGAPQLSSPPTPIWHPMIRSQV